MDISVRNAIKKCSVCDTEQSNKYVRGYCIICYNRLLKNGNLNSNKNTIPNKLSNRQQQILNGFLLGDGHLEKRLSTHNPILKIERSIKDQDYLIDNYNEFVNFCTDKKPRYRKKDGIVKFINFNTRSTPVFNTIYHKWYSDKIKIIPKDLELTPLTCAIWFCDDGFIHHNRNTLGIKLCTNGFIKQEVEFLCSLINQTIGAQFIVSKMNKKEKTYFMLAGANNTTLKFFNYIKKCIPKSMERKIRKINYETI